MPRAEVVQFPSIGHELPHMDQHLLDSLPELMAAVHALSLVEVGDESWAVCACGHCERVFHAFPLMCSLQAALDIFRSEMAWRYRQTVERTLDAGKRDEHELAMALRVNRN